MSDQLWSHLGPEESQRRVGIIREFYPDYVPLVEFATTGVDAAVGALQHQTRRRPVDNLWARYLDLVSASIWATTDILYSGDGQDARDIEECHAALWSECNAVLAVHTEALPPPITETVLASYLAERCEMDPWPGESAPAFLARVHDALTAGPAGEAPVPGSRLFTDETLASEIMTTDGFARTFSDGDARRAVSSLAWSWASSPDVLRRLSQHPASGIREAVVSNPMAPADVLARALEIYPYPREFWERFARIEAEEGAGADLPEWAWDEEEDDVTGYPDKRRWRWILGRNPCLPDTVLESLNDTVWGHPLENPIRAALLMHPQYPSGHVIDVLEQMSGAADWQFVSAAANPQVTTDVLAWLATGPMDFEVDGIDGFTALHILVGCALHPNANTEVWDRLSEYESDRVNCAVQAARTRTLEGE